MYVWSSRFAAINELLRFTTDCVRLFAKPYRIELLQPNAVYLNLSFHYDETATWTIACRHINTSLISLTSFGDIVMRRRQQRRTQTIDDCGWTIAVLCWAVTISSRTVHVLRPYRWETSRHLSQAYRKHRQTLDICSVDWIRDMFCARWVCRLFVCLRYGDRSRDGLTRTTHDITMHEHRKQHIYIIYSMATATDILLGLQTNANANTHNKYAQHVEKTGSYSLISCGK